MRTYLYILIGVILIAGCEVVNPIDPTPTLVSARDMLSKAVEYLMDKPANLPVAIDLIHQSKKSYEQGMKEITALKEANAELEKTLDAAVQLVPFKSIFFMIGGAGIVGGVFLLVSGALSTFKKAGIAIVASGGASLAIAIIVPAIVASSWIVALCVAGCLCALLIYFTAYIIQRQHIANVENVKTVNVAKMMATAPEPLTIAEVKAELKGIQSESTEAINDTIRGKLGMA